MPSKDQPDGVNGYDLLKPWSLIKMVAAGALALLPTLKYVQDPLILFLMPFASLIFIAATFHTFFVQWDAPPLNLEDPNKPRRECRYVLPLWIRTIPCLLIVVNVLWIMHSVRNALSNDPRRFVSVDHIERPYGMDGQLNGEPYAVGDMSLPYDDILTSKEPFWTLLRNAYYVRFAAQKPPRLSNVKIEKVLVTVLEFAEVERISVPAQAFPVDDEVLYVVDIDDPNRAKTSVFVAERYFEKDEVYEARRFAATILDNEIPASFVIRVDAKSPGLYKFRLSIEVSSGLDRQTIDIDAPVYVGEGSPLRKVHHVIYNRPDIPAFHDSPQ